MQALRECIREMNQQLHVRHLRGEHEHMKLVLAFAWLDTLSMHMPVNPSGYQTHAGMSSAMPLQPRKLHIARGNGQGA